MIFNDPAGMRLRAGSKCIGYIKVIVMQSQKDVVLFILFTTFLFFILVCFILTMLFLHNKQKDGLLKELELVKSDFEKELFETQLEIQEETLQHISLELHDNVGHFLSLAKLQLTTMNVPLPRDVTEKLEATESLLTYSLNEIRSISKNLNTENIKSYGLIKTVEQQIEQLKKSGSFSINLDVRGKACFLDDQKEIVLFRITQEALNNIVRHSKANHIDIGFNYGEDRLLLAICDNGIGFDVKDFLHSTVHRTSGLKNIIKRSSLINATHEISSVPGEGTKIVITTPY
jgi:two-component system NarL family sensor kinase